MSNQDKRSKKEQLSKNKSHERRPKKLSSGLTTIRQQIDRIDEKILALLEQRFSLSVGTVRYKTRLRDKTREKEVFARVAKKTASCEYLNFAFARKIYRLILRESLALEKSWGQEAANNLKPRPKRRTKEETNDRKGIN